MKTIIITILSLIGFSAMAQFGPNPTNYFPVAESLPANSMLVVNFPGDTNKNLPTTNALTLMNAIQDVKLASVADVNAASNILWAARIFPASGTNIYAKTNGNTVSLNLVATNLWTTNIYTVMQPVFITNRVLVLNNPSGTYTNTSIVYSETPTTPSTYVLNYANTMDDQLDGVVVYALQVWQPAFGSNTFELSALDDTYEYVGAVTVNGSSLGAPVGQSGTRVFNPLPGQLFWISNYVYTSMDGGEPPVSNVFSCTLYKMVTVTNLSPLP